ncbi:MAG: HAMP domain-containing histidine kinase, partial [Chloroflexota bacterium]|nr:HAMP domain-containing histidine kinase [Chloroflexota bacterium]
MLLSPTAFAHQVLEKLVPYLDRDELLVRLHALLQEVLPHDVGLVVTLEGDHPGELRLAVRYGLAAVGADLPDYITPATLIDPWSPGAGLLHIPDMQAAGVRIGDLFAGSGMRSLLTIPVPSNDGTAAVLLLARREAGAFSAVDDEQILALQQTLAVPLANAQYMTEHRHARESLLAHSTQLWQALGDRTDAATILPRLLDMALAISGAAAGTLLVLLPETDTLHVRVARGLSPHTPVADQVPWAAHTPPPLQDLTPLRLFRRLNTPNGLPLPVAVAADLHTFVALPVQSAATGTLLGLLNLYWHDDVAALDPEKEGLLDSLTRAVAAALEDSDLAVRQRQCERTLDQFHRHKARLQSVIGHQLRTPITSIGGYAQLLQRRAPDPSGPVARYADTILTESRRMEAVIDNVMELSRLDEALVAIEVRPFDLAAILADLAGDSVLRLQLGGAVTWDVPATLPTVLGDALRLKQALLALLRRHRAQQPARPLPVIVRATTAGRPAVELRLGQVAAAALWVPAAETLALLDLRKAVDSPQA